MPKDDRLSPKLSPYTIERLTKWAFVEGVESPSTQMALTTKARVDANEDLIDRKWDWFAKYYGLPVEVFDQKFRQYLQEGLRLPAIHERLKAEAVANGLSVSDGLSEDLEVDD